MCLEMSVTSSTQKNINDVLTFCPWNAGTPEDTGNETIISQVSVTSQS